MAMGKTGLATHDGLLEKSSTLWPAAPQSRNCSCGTYFHSEMYAGADPSPPLLVAYAPRITPTASLARHPHCLTYSRHFTPTRLHEGKGERADSPVKPQLSASFDASISIRASDLRAAGPAEKV